MTDNELLLAISDMMDKKLDVRLSPIENRMDSIENRMQDFGDQLAEVKSQMQDFGNQLAEVKSRTRRVEKHLHKIEIELLENNVIPRLDTIESCYIDTYNRYKDYADKMELVFEDIVIIKQVILEHSEKLQSIS